MMQTSDRFTKLNIFERRFQAIRADCRLLATTLSTLGRSGHGLAAGV